MTLSHGRGDAERCARTLRVGPVQILDDKQPNQPPFAPVSPAIFCRILDYRISPMSVELPIWFRVRRFAR